MISVAVASDLIYHSLSYLLLSFLLSIALLPSAVGWCWSLAVLIVVSVGQCLSLSQDTVSWYHKLSVGCAFYILAAALFPVLFAVNCVWREFVTCCYKKTLMVPMVC